MPFGRWPSLLLCAFLAASCARLRNSSLADAAQDSGIHTDQLLHDSRPPPDQRARLDGAMPTDLAVAPDMASGTPLHIFTRGGTGTDRALAVALDAQGNVYITGTFDAPLSLDPSTEIPTKGLTDVFAASFTSQGAHRWSRSFGSVGVDRPTALLISGSELIVTGLSDGALDVGGTVGTVAGYGAADAFIVALATSNGTPSWGKLFGGPGVDVAHAATLSPSGQIIIGGSFSGTASFGGGNLSVPGTDGFIVRMQPGGGVSGVSGLGGDGAVVRGLAHDGTLLYATGSFPATLTLGGISAVSTGGLDIFVVAYDAQQKALWLETFGSAGDDQAVAIAVGPKTLPTPSAGPVIVGLVGGPLVLDGRTFPYSGANDALLVALSEKGAHRWSRSFGSYGADGLAAVTVDSLGRVYSAGSFSAKVDPGGGPLTSSGARDVLVGCHRYSDGAHLWSRGFGGTLDDRGDGIAWQSGRLVVVGSFAGTVDFGGGLRTSQGAADLFWLALAP